MNFVTARILVLTGQPYSNGINSEIIAFRTDNDMIGLPDAPNGVYGATGGILNIGKSHYIIVCGGYLNPHNPNQRCMLWGENGYNTVGMSYERIYASSIVYNDKVSISCTSIFN